MQRLATARAATEGREASCILEKLCREQQLRTEDCHLLVNDTASLQFARSSCPYRPSRDICARPEHAYVMRTARSDSCYMRSCHLSTRPGVRGCASRGRELRWKALQQAMAWAGRVNSHLSCCY